MSLINKLTATILTVIFAFYLVINAFVPFLADWADDLSCVNAVDYGWVVYLIFLLIMLAIAYAVIKTLGIGK